LSDLINISNSLVIYLTIFLACLLAAYALYKRDKRKIEEQKRDLQLLFDLSRAIGSNLDLKLLIDDASRHLLPLVRGDRYALLLPNDQGAYALKFHRRLETVAGLEELIAMVSSHGEIVSGKNVVALPLAAKGLTAGILLLGGPAEVVFGGREKSLLTAAAGQLAVAVENAGLFEKERQAVSRLIELDRLKNEFVSLVSHELRTPVASADGYVSLFLAGVTGEISDDQKKYLTIIKDNNQRLLSLINRLLDFSSMETGRFAIKKELISINEIIGLAVKEAQADLDLKETKLTVSLEAGEPYFMGDEEKMKEVMFNLIDNALKFSADGVPAKINLAARNRDGLIEVRVEDNGIGIAKEYLESIFNEFYQIESAMTRKTGGVGLGLAIAREIVNKHRGRIWAESEGEGKGARIIFELPAAERVRQ
jgi:signal transduction histidine kinase